MSYLDKQYLKTIGHDRVVVHGATPFALPVPAADNLQVFYAMVCLEGDATSANPARSCYFRCDGGDPASGVGMAMADGQWTEIGCAQDVKIFLIIGDDPTKTHTLKVQFFGTDNI
jgi:hypothetical protein